MGHDIFARKPETPDYPHTEDAYLRRSMGSDTIHLFYRALNALDLDCGVSGSGEERLFQPDELEQALKNLPEEADEEKRFLRECLRLGGPIRILFA